MMPKSSEIEGLRPAPRRAYVLELKVEADTLKDLIGYLRHFETELYAGKVSTGVSGGYSSGATYSLSIDKTITHDSWAEAIEDYVQAIFTKAAPTMNTEDEKLLERLDREASCFENDYGADPEADYGTAKLIREAISTIRRLIAEGDAAREALRPFADLAEDYINDNSNIEDDLIMAGRMTHRGEEGTPPRVTFADFRRALLVRGAS